MISHLVLEIECAARGLVHNRIGSPSTVTAGRSPRPSASAATRSGASDGPSPPRSADSAGPARQLATVPPRRGPRPEPPRRAPPAPLRLRRVVVHFHEELVAVDPGGVGQACVEQSALAARACSARDPSGRRSAGARPPRRRGSPRQAARPPRRGDEERRDGLVHVDQALSLDAAGSPPTFTSPLPGLLKLSWSPAPGGSSSRDENAEGTWGRVRASCCGTR